MSSKISPETSGNQPQESTGQEKSYLKYLTESVEGVFWRVVGEGWRGRYIHQQTERPFSEMLYLSKEAKKFLQRSPEGCDVSRYFQPNEESKVDSSSTEGQKTRGWIVSALKSVKKGAAKVAAEAVEVFRGSSDSKDEEPIAITKEDIFVEIRDITEFIGAVRKATKAPESQRWFEKLEELVTEIINTLFGKGGISANIQLLSFLGGCHGVALQKAAEDLGLKGEVKGKDQILAFQTILELQIFLNQLMTREGVSPELKSKIGEYKKRLLDLNASALGGEVDLRDSVSKDIFIKRFLFRKTEGVFVLHLSEGKSGPGHAISINLEKKTIYDMNTGKHQFRTVEDLKKALEEKIDSLGYAKVSSWEIKASSS